MEISEFKEKLDNREFWGVNSKEMWDGAYKWEVEVNKKDNPIKWSWDCGLKLDYDGGICNISSRFYPPHKSSTEYGKYHGNIKVMIGDDTIHEKEIEASTLDELVNSTEEYVSSVVDKVKQKVKEIF